MKLRDNARTGSRVFVYRNLHTGCWSIKSKETGRVVAHADRVELSDARFKVSEAGRQRVLQEQRKNVHAGVEGTLEAYAPARAGVEPTPFPRATYTTGTPGGQKVEPVTYNPYKFSTFVIRGSERPVASAEAVVMEPREVWAINPRYL